MTPTAAQFPRSHDRRAFTLTELLVVIGLIVIIMALALPAFNFISGTKSVDGAINVVSAYMSRVRAEALATQRVTGVFFYIDPVTQRRAMATVQVPDANRIPGDVDYVDVYLELLDREPVLLPQGIDVQVINDATRISGGGQSDRYIGFNTRADLPAQYRANPTAIQYGSTILFDASGRLISPRWGLRLLQVRGNARTLTRMGAFFNPLLDASIQNPPGLGNLVPANDPPIRAGLGFVLFDSELFNNAGYTLTDPQVQGATYTAAEDSEEDWLDENATPLLINRYNGTLVRGQ